MSAHSILKLQDEWLNCTRCEIGKWAYRHVFGEGCMPAPFLFVGEGPGVSEDALGAPFVGRSGRLLWSALKEAGFQSGDWYVTNLVACRPCDSSNGSNRAPDAEEVLNCSPRLRGIVNLVKPKLIVAVGTVPAQWLSEEYTNYRIRQIYHPSYILRNGGREAEQYGKWLQSIKDLRGMI